jgi:serine protease Do
MEENRMNVDPEEGKETESEIKNEATVMESEITEKECKEAKNEESRYAFRWSYTEQDRANAEESKRKKRNGMKTYAIVMTAAFAVCFILLAAILILDGFANITETKIIENERTIYVREYDSESGVLTIPEIADKVKPSVVGIEITSSSSTSVGTGIIMTSDGYIATNAEVLRNAASVKVIMSDGVEKDAEIVGKDELSDLAVVKIDGEGYIAAEFGKSEELIVGELAVAVGASNVGELAGIVTDGIISAAGKNVKIFDENTGALKKTMTLIMTSAIVNEDNRGGPLVNDRGQVIGICTLMPADGYDGIGFAIPIDGAIEILNRIIETGGDVSEGNTSIAEKRVILGIMGGAVNRQSGAPVTGVYVSEITEGYDVENHLKVGDIIVGIDSYEVLAVSDVSAVLATKKAGDTVTLKVYRDGQLFDCDVIVDYEK